MKLDHFAIAVMIVVIAIVFIINYQTPERKLRWLDCETTFDSIMVTKPQSRGAFDIIDSLVFWSGYSPFDPTVCDTIPVTGVLCSIGDIDVPFIVYKPTPTDTLQVIKNNKTFYFRIPCDMNETEDG